MAVVQSYGALQRVEPRSAAPSSAYGETRGSGLDTACFATYAAIYRTQPQVRTVVDFLARNFAQVPFLVYRRVSDTDRVRLFDHELARWLTAPNYDTTGYRHREMLMQDLGIYGIAYWIKVRQSDRIGLVRVSPESILPVGWMLPVGYLWTKPDGTEWPLKVQDVCVFRYFNPDDPLTGLSPLETLRQLLTEDGTASSYRRAFWQNAARLEGVVQRPANAPKWTPEQKQAFREQWQSRYAGAPGQTAVLEDGMTFQATTYSARDSEFTATRKLTREEVTSAYHCPLPMVGILDHATFSNIREQHKHLYQDCLGPSFEMVQQEIERQLLIECRDRDRVYVEANIADKLKGSFEEQAGAMRSAVGRPWMTANEGRARFNLPSIKNDPTADALALPLNTSSGANDPITFTGEPSVPAEAEATYRRADPAIAASRAATGPLIRGTWDRQRSWLAKHEPDARAQAFDAGRWDRELAADLEQLYLGAGAEPASAARAARQLATSINADTLYLLVRNEDAFGAAREAALYVESGT